MQVKMSKGFGTGDPYESPHNWDCFVQGGDSGIVFSKNGNYETCFIEAFPKDPSCFIRGEGKTVEQADNDAWEKYQKIKVCNHEMERRDRTDGYAYCKHCSYSSTVFDPLTKCCKCNIPTAYTKDYRGNWYCKKHARVKPKNPNPQRFEMFSNGRRVPRVLKKFWKKCATAIFRSEGKNGKVVPKLKFGTHFECDGFILMMDFTGQRKSVIKRALALIAQAKKSKKVNNF